MGAQQTKEEKGTTTKGRGADDVGTNVNLLLFIFRKTEKKTHK